MTKFECRFCKVVWEFTDDDLAEGVHELALEDCFVMRAGISHSLRGIL